MFRYAVLKDIWWNTFYASKALNPALKNRGEDDGNYAQASEHGPERRGQLARMDPNDPRNAVMPKVHVAP